MGTPVSIYEVAKQLVANSGKAIEIEIVGLRAGEKVHEELFGDGEVDIRPSTSTYLTRPGSIGLF
jgi:FlaA1/EpsC-like NDP-sugar epimerase